ncbi:MAG: RNHCP domain-containing protein [Candidatus Falkowbacteria bacterium]|nr:RNHCP domain-containing protein [Candidatus Falkowbacteria bacterium]
MSSLKFQRKIENFICEQCGKKVIGNGYTNHCPYCLWAKHVDNNPGDRAATCQGLMEPIGLIISSKDQIIVHRCVICSKIIKNKVSKDDNQELIIELSKKILPNIK